MTILKRKIIASTVLIALILTGASLTASWLIRTKPHATKSDTAPLAPIVDVHRVKVGDAQPVYVGYGTARSDHQATLTAQVTGCIVSVAEGLKDGVQVEAGRMLVQIDDREYQHRLDRARSQVADAVASLSRLDTELVSLDKLAAIALREVEINRREMGRLSDLFESDSASRREFDLTSLDYQRSRRVLQDLRNQIALVEPRRTGLEAVRDARKADMALAALDVDRARVVAPFSGRVERVSVDMGDHVRLGSQILRLVSTDVIEVPIELAASVRPFVKPGVACVLSADSMPRFAWRGLVARVAPVVDDQSRTFAAYVEVDNRDQETPLVPGYFLSARIAGPLLRHVITVPRGAIVGDRVYVANGESAHVRTITVDEVIGDDAVVSGDLRDGDLVILTNLDVLEDGSPVRVRSDSSADVRSALVDRQAPVTEERQR
jgi:RND family efflux transporter MFP subunit